MCRHPRIEIWSEEFTLRGEFRQLELRRDVRSRKRVNLDSKSIVSRLRDITKRIL
jgi:inner membrane protein involved in colicin E2 resistance